MDGFIFNNYAPTQTTRMYFTPENAKRIDYFREQIEEWWNEKKLSYDEFEKPHNDVRVIRSTSPGALLIGRDIVL